jgi:adenylate kinase
MLNIKLSTLDAIKRLNDRGKTDRRRLYDVSTDLILNRLDEYEKKTKPVIEYYKKQTIFFEVDGSGSEDQVNERLEDAMIKAVKQLRG